MSIPFYPALFLLAALWGGSFLFMRIAAPVLGPVGLIEVRVLLAGLALLPLVMRRGQLAQLRDNWRLLLWVGLLNAALPFTLLAYSSLYLTAGTTSILNATVPIFGALIGFLVYRQALDRRRAFGVLLGFAGVVVLVGLPQAGEARSLPAVVVGLAAAVSYVFAANLARNRLGHVSGLVFVTGSQLGAAAILLPLLPFFPPPATPGALVLGAVLALALLSTSLAFLIYIQMIREVGPQRTLTVTYLIPLFAIAWGALLLDESLSLSMLIGGGLILLGVALANRRPPPVPGAPLPERR
ncbi:MAG: DMT family transporter [Gammaproteobacteria bacterium]|nr:DMT family transporter [Gammaproteobacteria bacterium]